MAEKKYIPLDAAIEMFEQAFDNNWEVSGTLDRLRAIPAADVVERKKEHIIEDVGERCICSGCRIELLCMYLDGPRLVTRPNVCPNCGADLREDEP